MNKNEKSTKDNTIKPTTVTPNTTTQQAKLGLFEEDDYFEEFEDEEWKEHHLKEEIDFKQWQEEWEDEEINDQFEKVLRKEIEAFKTASK
jgi:26 proteasome complex subunit DSS1